MELKDFIFTPLVILVILFLAYWARPYFTNKFNRKYYLPSLILRIASAILVGVLYQFYYSGGDTFSYHTKGSSIIHEAIFEDPEDGLRLLFGNSENMPYEYASRIPYITSRSSYFVVRVAALFDLFTYSTYSATAVIFAFVSFTGAWMMFRVFEDVAPSARKGFALAILFVPSVVFWGSGILKDTITLAAVGWGTYAFYLLVIKRKRQILNLLILAVCFYVIYLVKIYVLLSFIPPLMLWGVLHHMGNIRSVMLRWILLPVVLCISVISIYLILVVISEDNPRYSMNNLAKTAQITAYDIAFWTGKDSGSTYVLGELDGTYESLIRLAPEAINVSLFRPYFWEVQNPLMILAASESLFVFIFTFYVLFKSRLIYLPAVIKPITLACFLFSIMFAFAVGVSTFNFGTLSRYKIPLLPFYISALILILDQLNVLRKSGVEAFTE